MLICCRHWSAEWSVKYNKTEIDWDFHGREKYRSLKTLSSSQHRIKKLIGRSIPVQCWCFLCECVCVREETFNTYTSTIGEAQRCKTRKAQLIRSCLKPKLSSRAEPPEEARGIRARLKIAQLQPPKHITHGVVLLTRSSRKKLKINSYSRASSKASKQQWQQKRLASASSYWEFLCIHR